MPQLKTPPARSRSYLDFVKTEPCCFCHRPADDPHHFAGQKGTALRASDYLTVPLCREHHDEWHNRRKLGTLNSAETMAIFWKTSALLLARWIELGNQQEGKDDW